MTFEKTDIKTPADVEKLVHAFYIKVRCDTLLAPHFTQVNWEDHLPQFISFWSFVLLGTEGYKRNTWAKHTHVALSKENLAQWRMLFTKTVEENYIGDIATKAIQQARLMELTFLAKLENPTSIS